MPVRTFSHLLHGCAVLVVEDTMVVAMDAADILRAAGADTVDIAGRLDQAKVMVRDGTYALALVDVDLHGEQSQAVAQSLSGRGVPLVVMTAYENFDLLRAGYPQATLLSKPFDEAALLGAILSALGAT